MGAGDYPSDRPCDCRVVLNQADGEKELKAAEMILKLLPVTMQKGCAVTAYRK